MALHNETNTIKVKDEHGNIVMKYVKQEQSEKNDHSFTAEYSASLSRSSSTCSQASAVDTHESEEVG